MGIIRVHEFITVDGVFEDPSFTAPYGFTEQMGAELGGLTGSASAILLGRATFEMFAPAWSSRTAADDPGAPFFNDTTKYVVSSTLQDASAVWQNSTALGGYDADRIRALRDEVDGDLYISGSGTLVRALLAEGLVDELHLLVYPVVLGTGRRLLTDGMDNVPLSFVGHESFDNGVQHLTYEPAGR